MKYFLDFGAYTGDTVQDFYERPETFGTSDPKEYQVFAFEPARIGHWIYPGVEWVEKAAWIKDEKMTFYFGGDFCYGGEQNQSATIVRDGKPPLEGPTREVECFDFDKFISRLDGEIIVKMDIEGAEFPILEKLIKTGNINKITRLYVEFHNYRYKDGDSRRTAIINKLTIPYEEWH